MENSQPVRNPKSKVVELLAKGNFPPGLSTTAIELLADAKPATVQKQPKKAAKVGHPLTEIIAGLEFFRMVRENPGLVGIGASQIQQRVPELQQLDGSRSIGDGLGGHGWLCERHPKNPRLFLTSKSNFGLIVAGIAFTTELTEAEIADLAGFASLAEFHELWQSRPSNEELATRPVSEPRGKGKGAISAEDKERLREAARAAARIAREEVHQVVERIQAQAPTTAPDDEEPQEEVTDPAAASTKAKLERMRIAQPRCIDDEE